jgi:CelD/BcsL family acetyltransferase involved in cellulose biosynthesis
VQVATTPPAIAPAVDDAVHGLTVETVTDERAFLQLQDEWDDAVDRAQVGHPFLSHDWIRTWWECFGRAARLHIVVVRSAGQVVAIAPLLFERARMYGMPVRRLRLLQNDHSPRADFIVASHGTQAFRAIWTSLFHDRHDWDVLQLSQLPPETPTLQVMTSLAGADGCATGIWQSGSSPYLPLDGTETDYFAGLSAKFRQNLRNRMTRLTRVGQPALEIVTDSALHEAVSDAIRLEESGWKRDAGTAISTDPMIGQFYLRLAERMAERGWLRLMFLNVNGRRIATSYSIRHRGRLFLCKTGYDPEYNTCSPFKLLMHFIVRYAYAEGANEIDLLGDAEPWKEEWTETSRPHNWLFVFSDSNRARLLYPLKFQLVPAVKRTGVVDLILKS